MRSLMACLLMALPLAAADLKVATLHPLLTDLARQVGGERVEVIDLVGPNGDPHKFEPAPADLARSKDARLYLASGMGMETYLPSLRGVLEKSASVVEVGKDFPAITCDHDHDHHDHDGHDHHHHHGVDPHWWHSIDLFRRAVTVTASEFTKADPAGKEVYEKNAAAYSSRLEELDRWARKQIAGIPRDQRRLATAHAAFAYFCKDHGFQAIPVQGVNREQMPSAAELGKLINELKKEKVAALFPERESNPKILQALTKDTGIALGTPLYADGMGAPSYEEMIRHNIEAIVKGLVK